MDIRPHFQNQNKTKITPKLTIKTRPTKPDRPQTVSGNEHSWGLYPSVCGVLRAGWPLKANALSPEGYLQAGAGGEKTGQAT